METSPSLLASLVSGCFAGSFLGFSLCYCFPKLGRQLNELLTFGK